MATATLPASVMVSMLKKGDNGNQILEILETLVPSVQQENNAQQGTLDPIDF